MTKHDLNDTELDDLFASARRAVPDPSDDFMARLMQDADAAAQPVTRPAMRISWFDQVRDVLGGWRGLGGLALATVAGVWIGVAPPSSLPDPVFMVSQLTTEAATIDTWLSLDATEWQEFEDG